MTRPMLMAVVVSAVTASAVSSLITFSLSTAMPPARPVQTVRVQPRAPDNTSEQFVATRDGDRRAVLTAVEDGVGLMLTEGRRPRVHLFAQHDGQEGLAFYDQSGPL